MHGAGQKLTCSRLILPTRVLYALQSDPTNPIRCMGDSPLATHPSIPETAYWSKRRMLLDPISPITCFTAAGSTDSW